MSSNLIIDISRYCEGVNGYCVNFNNGMPSDNKIKSICNWENFQKKIVVSGINNDKVKSVTNKIDVLLEKIEATKNERLRIGVHDINEPLEYLNDLEIARKNIYNLHKNFDHYRIEELSKKIKNNIDKKIESINTDIAVKRRAMRGGNKKGLLLALLGSVLPIALGIGAVIGSLAVASGAWPLVLGLGAVAFMVALALVIFRVIWVSGCKCDDQASRLMKENKENENQICDLQRFKKIMTPENIRVIFDSPKLHEEDRNKYIKLLFALDKLCPEWNQEIEDKPTEESLKDDLESSYGKSHDNATIVKNRLKFEEMQNNIKNCFGGSLAKFEMSCSAKDILDYLIELRKLNMDFSTLSTLETTK